MATPNPDLNALQEQVETLTTEAEDRETKITELETALAERPSEEEVNSMRAQITELETDIHTKDVEVARVQHLAAQGEKALQLEKDTAKRSVLASMSLNPAEDHSNNYEYVKRCKDIDEMTDIKSIQSLSNSNFAGKTGRKSSISGYQAPITNGKKPAHSGANML